jgi:hypothetical protein
VKEDNYDMGQVKRFVCLVYSVKYNFLQFLFLDIITFIHKKEEDIINFIKKVIKTNLISYKNNTCNTFEWLSLSRKYCHPCNIHVNSIDTLIYIYIYIYIFFKDNKEEDSLFTTLTRIVQLITLMFGLTCGSYMSVSQVCSPKLNLKNLIKKKTNKIRGG